MINVSGNISKEESSETSNLSLTDLVGTVKTRGMNSMCIWLVTYQRPYTISQRAQIVESVSMCVCSWGGKSPAAEAN